MIERYTIKFGPAVTQKEQIGLRKVRIKLT
jgi:hypothetical protein